MMGRVTLLLNVIQQKTQQLVIKGLYKAASKHEKLYIFYTQQQQQRHPWDDGDNAVLVSISRGVDKHGPTDCVTPRSQ
jgi:hypothetical protein